LIHAKESNQQQSLKMLPNSLRTPTQTAQLGFSHAAKV
jgi:hypothetical protein